MAVTMAVTMAAVMMMVMSIGAMIARIGAADESAVEIGAHESFRSIDGCAGDDLNGSVLHFLPGAGSHAACDGEFCAARGDPAGNGTGFMRGRG